MRHNILEQLHASHQGIDKTKSLLENVYLPKSFESICASCHLCQEMQHQQTSQPLHPHERPMSPWVMVGSDIFIIRNNNFLSISDYYSPYQVVKKLPSFSASATILATTQAFSILGTPHEIISNYGPQFQREYNEFYEQWNISTRYPNTNGFIECDIQDIKPIIKKSIASSGDLHLAMMKVRATPLSSILPIPAELLFGRKISTTLPGYQHIAVNDDTREHFANFTNQQKSYNDKNNI